MVKTQNTGVIVGAMGFGKEFDTYTLEAVFEQVKRAGWKITQNSHSR